VPPYCGVPRLSHQFPVEVVVTEVVTGDVDVVELVTTAVCVVVVIEIVDVVVGVVDVLVVEEDEPQDASISDATIRKLSATQINPFFILQIICKTGQTTNPDYSQGSEHGRGHQPHLAESPTTNSQYLGFPWQGQSYNS
jgi:hypothetical protein